MVGGGRDYKGISAACLLPGALSSLQPHSLSSLQVLARPPHGASKLSPGGGIHPPLLHPCRRAVVSFGSFCGLGLLFLSTVVRKPLPQKVSAGGLVYRGEAPQGLQVGHTPNSQTGTATKGAIKLSFPWSRWFALGQVLSLSVTQLYIQSFIPVQIPHGNKQTNKSGSIKGVDEMLVAWVPDRCPLFVDRLPQGSFWGMTSTPHGHSGWDCHSRHLGLSCPLGYDTLGRPGNWNPVWRDKRLGTR